MNTRIYICMRILVAFGGQSVEHDISVLTGLHLMKHINTRYSVYVCHTTTSGSFEVASRRGKLSNVDYYTKSGGSKSTPNSRRAHARGVAKILRLKPDVVINCCHGGAGEDGRLFAFFQTLGVPMTSCPTHAAMDLQSKSRTREVLAAAGFAQPKWVVVTSVAEIPKIATEMMSGETVEPVLSFPVIVKPDTLGSSIGISVAKNDVELRAAVEAALLLDTRVVVEQFIGDADEVNCSAFKRGGEVLVSACEVMNKKGELLNYETKYIEEGSGFIKKSGNQTVHKDESKIKELTERAYNLFGTKGVVRADFLVANNQIYLNEINTVPGFMAYHLWLKTGLPYETLIEMLIAEALSEPQNRLITDFKSEILAKNRSLVVRKKRL